MEIVLRIITAVIISVFVAEMIDLLLPKFRKRETLNEQQAALEKKVKLSRGLFITFLTLLIFVNAIGILIVALPKIITEYMGFNYIVTILIWWIPLVFDDIIGYFLFTQAVYNDEKIVVKKLFSKPKTYYFSEIVSFSQTGNLKVKTSSGSFMLFNVLAGTSSLRKSIMQKNV